MRKSQAYSAVANLLFASAFLAAIFGCGMAYADTTSEDWPVLAEISQRKLEKDPADQKAWTDLVRARLALSDFTRAENLILEWCAGKAPAAPLNIELMGEAHFGQGKYSAAIEDWKTYLNQEPGNADAWARLAAAYEELQQWEDSRAAISHALDISPKADWFALQADYGIRLHDWSGAAADVQKGNRLDATSAAIQKLFPTFEQYSKWSGAVQGLDRAVGKKPNDAQLRIDRAEELVGLGFIDAAGDDVHEAVRLDPKSLRVRFWSGAMAQWNNEPSKAGDVMPVDGTLMTPQFERELKIADRSRNPEDRALFLLRWHQPLMALNEVQDVDGSVAKASALLDLDRLTAVGKAAHRAVEIHPKDAVAWLDLARVDLANGNIAEAMDDSARSLKLKRTPEAEELHGKAARRLSVQ